jgi:hypothetical protein
MGQEYWIVRAIGPSSGEWHTYGDWFDHPVRAERALNKAVIESPALDWKVVRLIEAPAEPEPSAAVDVAELAAQVGRLETSTLLNDGRISSTNYTLYGGVDPTTFEKVPGVVDMLNDAIRRIASLEDRLSPPDSRPIAPTTRMVRAAFDEPWAPALACVPEWCRFVTVDADCEMFGYEYAPADRVSHWEEVAETGCVRLGIVDLAAHNLDWRDSLRKVIR